MEKSNLELFKQALNEGLSNRIESTINECTVEINPSRQHIFAMRTIIYGKGYTCKPLSPRMRKVIAILVAVALLLTSCVIIYREEICGFAEEITESFTRLRHPDDETVGTAIEEFYELTYVPEGYTLENTYVNPLLNKIILRNSNGDTISFTQNLLNTSLFFVDIGDYKTVIVVKTYDVYYKTANDHHYYLWNDGKYAMKITSDTILSNEDIISIINNVKAK